MALIPLKRHPDILEAAPQRFATLLPVTCEAENRPHSTDHPHRRSVHDEIWETKCLAERGAELNYKARRELAIVP